VNYEKNKKGFLFYETPCRTILPYSKVIKTLEETFAATNFNTRSIHEWTKWPSAIGWLARGLADVRLRLLIFMTLACARRK